MAFGVTPDGFELKRFEDIAAETDLAYKAIFGDGINLSPESALGQIKNIRDERESSLWELAQAVYDARFPLTSFNSSLDKVSSITNVTRLLATNSFVVARIFGTLAATVPIGFVASVLGDPTATFETQSSDIIGTGIDEVQKVAFSSVPTTGSFKLKLGTEETVAMDETTVNTDVQTNLNNLTSLSTVVVTGDFTLGFTITFTGADGEQDQVLLEVTENTLLDVATPVTTTVTEETQGFAPFVDIPMIAQNTGPVIANAGSLTQIETPEGGILSLTNLLDAIVGQDLETDPEYKLRRLQLLQRRGTATLEGIRNNILAVDDVIQSVVVENATNIVDIDGRPPKSFEAFALEGDEQEIAQAIFESKPAGIETFGTISKIVLDSQGFAHTINFSRPVEIDIWVIANINPNTDPAEGPLYPVTGDQEVEDAILAFAVDFLIGQDVIVNQFFTPINTVAGVFGIELLMGIAPSPTLSNNIVIATPEIARFDSTRVEVNS